MLGRVVGLHSPQEVLSAAAGSHMLNAHIDPLLEYPVADLHEWHCPSDSALIL